MTFNLRLMNVNYIFTDKYFALIKNIVFDILNTESKEILILPSVILAV